MDFISQLEVIVVRTSSLVRNGSGSLSSFWSAEGNQWEQKSQMITDFISDWISLSLCSLACIRYAEGNQFEQMKLNGNSTLLVQICSARFQSAAIYSPRLQSASIHFLLLFLLLCVLFCYCLSPSTIVHHFLDLLLYLYSYLYCTYKYNWFQRMIKNIYLFIYHAFWAFFWVEET